MSSKIRTDPQVAIITHTSLIRVEKGWRVGKEQVGQKIEPPSPAHCFLRRVDEFVKY